MAGLIDVFSLIVTFGLFGGAIYVIVSIVQSVNKSVSSTRESLKAQGLEISGSGVSVKTQKRFDREDYVDATQRGFVRAMGAASIRKADGSVLSVIPPTKMERQTSNMSVKSSESQEKKKKGSIFGGKNGKK
ncbi:hypothetical protein CVT24_000941 [Panaeolus cyanescens]|uniref:Uncharacterized protein n=1 Tax=Panaeolus cyanescens TaxID=181874 RepID=A0A409YCK6_9AGAR|nr:hypothetical protein CVT24_000941 [Panaeolus cyanescens]